MNLVIRKLAMYEQRKIEEERIGKLQEYVTKLNDTQLRQNIRKVLEQVGYYAI